jgi:hypothetical protein
MREFFDQVEFQANLPHFLQRYPNGFPPYVSGIPVLT